MGSDGAVGNIEHTVCLRDSSHPENAEWCYTAGTARARAAWESPLNFVPAVSSRLVCLI